MMKVLSQSSAMRSINYGNNKSNAESDLDLEYNENNGQSVFRISKTMLRKKNDG
jgi:hypothetical protein